MSSRDKMLARLREQQRDGVPLPRVTFSIPANGLAAQFLKTSESVGGTCFAVPDYGSLSRVVRELDVYTHAKKIVSKVDPIPGNVLINNLSYPHELADVDVSILPGVFGVAENGAVWLDMNCLGPLRAVFVIPQHLILVLNADQIVNTMHDAYERFDLNTHDFGVFISGPSKTADIEQSLVIGAHGARSCTVFLVG